MVHHLLFKSKTFFRFIFIHIHSKSTTFSSFTVFLQERNSKKRSDDVLFCFVFYNIILPKKENLNKSERKERSEMFSFVLHVSSLASQSVTTSWDRVGSVGVGTLPLAKLASKFVFWGRGDEKF